MVSPFSLTVIAGTVSLQISFLVAFSQLVPAHTVTLFRGLLSMRVPRFPLLYIGVVTLLSMTPFLSSASVWLSTFGFFTSWTYLRFYKTAFPDLDSSQPTSLRGDASETFALAEFFPARSDPLWQRCRLKFLMFWLRCAFALPFPPWICQWLAENGPCSEAPRAVPEQRQKGEEL